MRLLPTLALVLASLAFTVGGVAIVGRADSTDASPKAPPVPAALGAVPAQTQCATPVHHDVRIPASRLKGATEVIVLNTRGYNYAAPGDLPMDPTTGRAAPVTPDAKPAPAPDKR
jgi:hypothetical protein